MADVEDYLATLGADDRAAFARVVAVVRELAPDAEEGTSYGMAALRWQGKPLLGLRAAAKHLAVFPFSPQAVEAASDLLDHLAVRLPKHWLPDEIRFIDTLPLGATGKIDKKQLRIDYARHETKAS